jgi:hypothetical protein
LKSAKKVVGLSVTDGDQQYSIGLNEQSECNPMFLTIKHGSLKASNIRANLFDAFSVGTFSAIFVGFRSFYSLNPTL